VRIVDGRAFDANHGADEAPGTTLVASTDVRTPNVEVRRM
jgi:hypothetical protein